MLIQVNKKLSVPVFMQIKNQIKTAILEKKLGENELLPSVREIVKHTKVSLATVQKAFDELNREGLIYSRVGIGNFVSSAILNFANKVHIFLPSFALTFFIKILNGIFTQANVHKLKTQIHSLNSHKLKWNQETVEFLYRSADENASIIFIEEAFGEIREHCRKTAQLVPFTTIEWTLEGANAVINDYEKATYDVMSYLINERNARKILVLKGIEVQYNSIHKLAGVKRYVQNHNLGDNVHYLATKYNAISAYEQVKEFLSRQKVDAIFCANDYEAIGTVGALTEAGILAGKEIAVVGFGDMPDETTNYFPLTTVSQNLEMVGIKAVDCLIEQKKGNPAKTLEVPTKFIIRKT